MTTQQEFWIWIQRISQLITLLNTVNSVINGDYNDLLMQISQVFMYF